MAGGKTFVTYRVRKTCAVTNFGCGPSVKHRIAPGKEFRISRKKERYTVAIVEFLRHLLSLKTMLGGVMSHGGSPGTMGGRQWKWKFLDRVWLRKYPMWVNDSR